MKTAILNREIEIKMKKIHPARVGYPIAATIALVTGQPYMAVSMGLIGISDCFNISISKLPEVRKADTDQPTK